MISLCCCTYRPGSFDLFANSFLGMPPGDYELLIVDDFPGRVGRGTVPKFFRDKGVNLTWYGGSKPKSRPETKGGLCNAMNTALIHVKGEYVVFVSDYAVLPSVWLKQWERVREVHGDETLVSGGAIVYGANKPKNPTDVQTWDGDIQMIPKWPWVPEVFETFYWGTGIKHWCDINGEDERADHSHCWPVSSKIAQARILGLTMKVEPQLAVHLIDHRPWDCPEEPNPIGLEGLWKITAAVQSLETEPSWEVPSPNPFNLKKLREEAR